MASTLTKRALLIKTCLLDNILQCKHCSNTFSLKQPYILYMTAHPNSFWVLKNPFVRGD